MGIKRELRFCADDADPSDASRTFHQISVMRLVIPPMLHH